MSTIISIEDVSKLYRLGEIGTGSLAHDVNRWWHKVRGKEDPYLKVGQSNDRSIKGDSDYVYAIKDISFDVKQGEVLGIIGRNGAGKSTLLKILSRVTTPTSGQIKVKGRIASLLEVGTGFHPELTGKENIFLNGAILGMQKSEIRSKFDEIVAFSGCERYINTPVKRYSSGMYVRLAFAVAAHLEPEILIVDEVLAVGDAEFQKRCLGKMKEVAGEGKTVIFVSHNMAAVTSLTRTTICLDQGRLSFAGSTADGVTYYLNSSSKGQQGYLASKDTRKPYIGEISLVPEGSVTVHRSGDDLTFRIRVQHPQPKEGICLSVYLVNQQQVNVAHLWIFDPETPVFRSGKSTELVCRIPRCQLNAGGYSITAYLAEPPGGEIFDVVENVCSFSVEVIGKQNLYGWRPDVCTFLLDHEWSHGGITIKQDLENTP